MIRSSADEIKSSIAMDDKLREFFPRLLRYLKEDLSKETLTSEAENVRLQLIQLTEDLSRDSAAKQIDSKYDHVRRTADEAAAAQIRTGVLKANSLLLLPFGRPSTEEVKDDDKRSEHQNEISSSANVKTAHLYESPVNDVYEEMVMPRSAQVNSSSSSRAPLPKPSVEEFHAYEDPSSFGFATERIPEASNSESESDYEDYDKDNGNDKDLCDSKSDDRGDCRESIGGVSLRYSGVLYRSEGSFGQGRRQLCGIRGGSFVCFKGISSFKVVLELVLSEYEVTAQERSDARSSAWTHEIRFSGPAKETHLFYAGSRQDAENWLKELHKSTAIKDDNFEQNAEDKKPQNNNSNNDNNDNQQQEDSVNMAISAGIGERRDSGAAKSLIQHHQSTDDVRKKSKLQSFFETVGKRRNKNKNSQQTPSDVISPQQLTDSKPGCGYLNIWSEVYTGDRWFRRYCRIEDGRLNCFGDHVTDSRPEFSLSLRGAQLKPLDVKDGLKITIVQDQMEHRLKMSDFMDHGKWLASLIRETGFALQLVNASKQSSSSSKTFSPLQAPTGDGCPCPEQLRALYNFDDVTLKESFSDEEPPPLPEYSPPSSPSYNENSVTGGRGRGEGGGGADEEPIYLEPMELQTELDEIQRKKRFQKNQSAVKIPSKEEEEESLYVNREFLTPERKTSKETRKADQMVKSASSPNIVSAELTKVAKEEREEGRTRRGGGGGGGGGGAIRKNDVIVSGGKPNVCSRPSSGKTERRENAKDKKSENLHLNTGVRDSAPAMMSQGRRQDGCETKTTDSCRDSVVCVEANVSARIERTETVSGHDVIRSSTRTSDYNGKKVVQDLVKIFERRT